MKLKLQWKFSAIYELFLIHNQKPFFVAKKKEEEEKIKRDDKNLWTKCYLNKWNKKWYSSKLLSMEYWKKPRITKCQKVCADFCFFFRLAFCSTWSVAFLKQQKKSVCVYFDCTWKKNYSEKNDPKKWLKTKFRREKTKKCWMAKNKCQKSCVVQWFEMFILQEITTQTEYWSQKSLLIGKSKGEKIESNQWNWSFWIICLVTKKQKRKMFWAKNNAH